MSNKTLENDFVSWGMVKIENLEQSSDEIMSNKTLENDYTTWGTMTKESHEQSSDTMSKIKLENDCTTWGTMTTENHEQSTNTMSKIKLEYDCARSDTMSTENDEKSNDYIMSDIKLENEYATCALGTMKTENNETSTDDMPKIKLEYDCASWDTMSTENDEKSSDDVMLQIKQENDYVSGGAGSADGSPKDLRASVCTCEECGWSFKDQHSFQHHMRSLHNVEEQIQGSAVEKTVPTKNHKGFRAFSCALCGDMHLSQFYLNRHKCDGLESTVWMIIERDTSSKLDNYECAVCNRIFSIMSTWKRHMDVHLGQQRQQCTLCLRRFSDRRDLRSHMNRSHSKEFGKNNSLQTEKGRAKQKRGSKDMYSCNVCSKSFAFMTPLRIHVKEHFESHPYLCSVCCKSFKSIGMLTKHTKECIEERSLSPLSLVDKSSPTCSDGLQGHTEEKRNEEKYQCFLCDKELKSEEKLKSHLRIHTGIKPHACSECSKRFNFPSELKLHMKTHAK